MNIRRESHWFYYLSLLVMEVFAFSLILSAQGNTSLQLRYTMLAAGIYVIWGVVHHGINHTLHKKVIIEYLLMGLLGISIVYFFLR
ncbi:MAG TPA: hypothetical protein VG935_04395 [Patescibacteria group bacterium]|nr:hypothetical protein [Patescibacteria group bacterium]